MRSCSPCLPPPPPPTVGCPFQNRQQEAAGVRGVSAVTYITPDGTARPEIFFEAAKP